jgi:hypothetical protein
MSVEEKKSVRREKKEKRRRERTSEQGLGMSKGSNPETWGKTFGQPLLEKENAVGQVFHPLTERQRGWVERSPLLWNGGVQETLDQVLVLMEAEGVVLEVCSEER